MIILVDFGSCTYQAMDKMLTVVGTPFWSMSSRHQCLADLLI